MRKIAMFGLTISGLFFSGCFWDKEPQVVIKKVPVPAMCTTEVYQSPTNPNVLYPVTTNCVNCGMLDCTNARPTIKWDSYRYDRCDNCFAY